MSSQPASKDTGAEPDTSKKTGPKPPQAKHHFLPAILSFVSGGFVVALGDLNKHGNEDVQVAFTTKSTDTDLPYLGLRIKLKRSKDTMPLRDGDQKEFHTVLFKYLRDDYEIEHHRANLKEKERFLNLTNNSAVAQKACDNDRLYVIKFSLGGNRGPEVHGFGSSFVGSNQDVNDKYNHLSSITSCQIVDVYLWEYNNLPLHLQWSISDQATRTDPLLHYYMPSKKTTEPQAYVQWNQLRDKDVNNNKPFQRRRGFHDFDNFTVMYGCSEAYEQDHIFALSKQLRSLHISMAVLQPPGSNGDYYFGFLFVNEWDQYQRLFDPLDKVLITWAPPPEIKPAWPKEEGSKDPQDNAPGWTAVVMEDNAIFSDAPLMVMLCRPSKNDPLADKKMRAAQNVDEGMPVQNVYIKTSPSAATIKTRLKALDKHRYRNNNSREFDEKRRVLVGRDLSVNRHDDLLEGIPKEKVDEIIADLNPSQREFITKHCRDVHHGINLILGPFGSGKTVLVSKLCELQKLRSPTSKSFVAASSESACDAVVPKFANTGLMVVRAYGLSVERESLLQRYFEAQRTGKLAKADALPADYEPPVRSRPVKKQQRYEVEEAVSIEQVQAADDEPLPENDHEDSAAPSIGRIDNDEDVEEQPQGGELESKAGEEAELEKDSDEREITDTMIVRATVDIMKLCQQKYESRVRFLDPQKPRMRKIEVAIHTWILKFAGVIDSKYNPGPMKQDGQQDEFSQFRSLYEKSKTHNLNDDEWQKLQNSMLLLSQVVLKAADVIIATPIQAQTDLLKDIVFEHVIIDEASVLTHLEMLCAWRGTENLTLIGDNKQLPTTVLTTTDQNPFAIVQGYGPFQRFADLGLRVFVLRHVMRMTIGLEDLCNTVFYDSKLICGPGTSINDPKRRLSSIVHDIVQRQFPGLKEPPVNSAYPVFLDVAGTCYQEPNGTSRVNAYNIAFIISTIKVLRAKLADKKYNLKNNQIGIVTPYAAQVRATRRALHRANEFNIRVGVTESWQGGETDVMFVDLVRAKKNDFGALGFLAKKERLNVLLSRQQQFLFVVGDMKCCESSFGTSQPANGANATSKPANEPVGADDISGGATWNKNDKRNAWILKVLAWFREHGRAVQIPMTAITEDYITFPKDEKDDGGAESGWGDDKENQDEQDGQDGQDGQDEEEKLTQLMKQEIEKLQKQLEQLEGKQLEKKLEKKIEKQDKKQNKKQIEKKA